MQQGSDNPAALSLDPFIGERSMQAFFPGAAPSDLRGLTGFEWVADPALLVQRWEVPLPEAPDGIAIIRFDETRGIYLQHCFDSRTATGASRAPPDGCRPAPLSGGASLRRPCRRQG